MLLPKRSPSPMTQPSPRTSRPLRIGLVVPHIFMQQALLPQVIFSPGALSLELARGLAGLGAQVTLFTPGPVDTPVRNLTANLAGFEAELLARGYGTIELLKRHPLVFVSLARQVQSELIAQSYRMLSAGELDVVHIYTNEEDIALPFARLVSGPVVFTHHDPFRLLIKYKHNFGQYADLNWLSLSQAQRLGMPARTNWLANIYHGLDQHVWVAPAPRSRDYVLYLGRIVEPKGLHLAIAAARKANLRLVIAGKHYAGHSKDTYWTDRIEPQLQVGKAEYVGYVSSVAERQELLAGAAALLVPSIFDEPFGMVMIEALASGTPVVGLESGAIPEVVQSGRTGYVVRPGATEEITTDGLAEALKRVTQLSSADCRADFEFRFTLERMAQEHLGVYTSLVTR